MTIIEQLTKIYHEKEFWHKKKLPVEEINNYHEKMMNMRQILTYIVDGELIGYLEFYRITFEQFGRICCNEQLSDTEDLSSGPVAFINRMYIKEEHRRSDLFMELVNQFIERNINAEHYATLQHHKKHKSLQVFYRKDWVKTN